MFVFLTLFATAIAQEFEEFEDSEYYESYDDYTYEEYEEPEIDQGLFKDVKCGLCQNLVQKAEDYVTQHGAQGLGDYLKKKFCPSTPIVHETCYALVDSILDKAIQMIQQKLPPQTVCKKLKACK
ncbi:uncharacterized protein MONOS_1152 [Monocercomonoides exilis]|uniref:uncharacterized protein n=1 Tax=Monocercomonoides exilis TaxID=2049356 RepID=UPI00355963E4|nr:hypothetical protein MONOS_1152 [Monocercomonoides exilis]|eukprot:MONOS_1152.1-p1 / transcript=MONOS_1152.1 / gene=MONOS_1152 / organism=Monocercomonoides_exilis_PA203 / gene_product=unspecified product / transcript_product=unspecified product / location=Mono_scaffold00019:196827-197276(-) / protein_length=124 / sequence_SO=supercontig / SO=protein_coding / is_pseudo=false